MDSRESRNMHSTPQFGREHRPTTESGNADEASSGRSLEEALANVKVNPKAPPNAKASSRAEGERSGQRCPGDVPEGPPGVVQSSLHVDGANPAIQAGASFCLDPLDAALKRFQHLLSGQSVILGERLSHQAGEEKGDLEISSPPAVVQPRGVDSKRLSYHSSSTVSVPSAPSVEPRGGERSHHRFQDDAPEHPSEIAQPSLRVDGANPATQAGPVVTSAAGSSPRSEARRRSNERDRPPMQASQVGPLVSTPRSEARRRSNDRDRPPGQVEPVPAKTKAGRGAAHVTPTRSQQPQQPQRSAVTKEPSTSSAGPVSGATSGVVSVTTHTTVRGYRLRSTSAQEQVSMQELDVCRMPEVSAAQDPHRKNKKGQKTLSRRGSVEGETNVVQQLKHEVSSKDREIAELRKLCEAQAQELHQFRSESSAETETLKSRMSMLEQMLDRPGELLEQLGRFQPPSEECVSQTTASPTRTLPFGSPRRRMDSPPRVLSERGTGVEVQPLSPSGGSTCGISTIAAQETMSDDLVDTLHYGALARRRERSAEVRTDRGGSRSRVGSFEIADNRIGLVRSASQSSTHPAVPPKAASKSGSGFSSPRNSLLGISAEKTPRSSFALEAQARVLQRSMSGGIPAMPSTTGYPGPSASPNAACSGGQLSPRARAVNNFNSALPATPTMGASLAAEAWTATMGVAAGGARHVARQSSGAVRTLSPSDSSSSFCRTNSAILSPAPGVPSRPLLHATVSSGNVVTVVRKVGAAQLGAGAAYYS